MSKIKNLRSWLPGEYPLLGIVVVFQIAFLVLPTLIVFYVSFAAGQTITFPPESYSLRWYAALPGESEFIRGFQNSLIASLIAVMIAVPAGVATAIGLIRYDIRFKNTLQIYFLLPFTVPLVVTGAVLLVVYGELGWLGVLWPIGLAFVVIEIPFILWSISSSVNNIEPNLELASKSLGGEELQTFWNVTLPQILPGVITGALLIFVLALNEFIVSLFITTVETTTLPVMIFTSIRGDISPLIAAISSVYILIAFAAIVIADRLVGLERFLHS